MRRGAWFVAGAVAGVYGAVRARRIVEAFTIDGMRDRVGAAVVGARLLRDEFAQGMVEAETDLRERYQVAAMRRPGLETPSLVPRDGFSTTESKKKEGTD